MTGSGDLKDTVLKILQDPEITSPLLEKVRIFFNQAMDTDHLKELGIEPARPYLDMLDAVTDLEGLNAVLTSEDFPFSPFLSAYLCPRDSREPMSFALYPNFMTTDNLEGAKNFKEESVIGAQADSEKTNLVRQILMKLYPDTETELLYQRLASFEKQYRQYGIYTDLFSSMEYGTADRLISQMTVPEMEEAFKNFPVRGILEKDGRDLSLTYKIPCREWLEELDRMWTEDNLETLVLAAKVKVLQEAAADLNGMLVCLKLAESYADFDYDAFFRSYAAMYADCLPAMAGMMLAEYDSHPLGYLRINVNAQMADRFYEVYDVQPGDGMYLAPEDRIRFFGQ